MTPRARRSHPLPPIPVKKPVINLTKPRLPGTAVNSQTHPNERSQAQKPSDRIQALAQPRRYVPTSSGDVNPRQILAVAKAHGLVSQPKFSPEAKTCSTTLRREIAPDVYQHSKHPAKDPGAAQANATKAKPAVRKQDNRAAFKSHFGIPRKQFSTVKVSDSVPAYRENSSSLPDRYPRVLSVTADRVPKRALPAAGSANAPVEPNHVRRKAENGDSEHQIPGKSTGFPADNFSLDSLVTSHAVTEEADAVEVELNIVHSPAPLEKSVNSVGISLIPIPDPSERTAESEYRAETADSTAFLQSESIEDSSESSDSEESVPVVKFPTRKSEATTNSPPTAKCHPVIKYYTDQGFRPLLCAFRNLQWRDFAHRGRWHMLWANVANARALFQPGQRYYFNDDQLINHYQTCYHLSRKDNMTKNIKKFRTEMAQLKDPIGRKDKHGNFVYLDLIAPTYLLPFDFNTFTVDFKKNGGLYIVKPCSGSQGQGIFLVNQLDQAKRWQERALAEVAASVQENESYQGYLISRYISNPLLIDGKKFDLRIYILVTCFKPLRCYYYRQGFCRFCATRYSPDIGSIDDKFMHLTNVAVQKQKKGYNRSHGNKWSITAFRLYMERVYGRGKIDSLFDRILWTIVQSLRSVQSVMDNDRHSYEMYGYDCLIDAHLKPWLLEINAGPSLEDTTAVDRVIKTNLLTDTMRMALYERCPHLLGIKEKKADASDMPLGDYEILYLEEPAPILTPAERRKKVNQARCGQAVGTAPPVSVASAGKHKPRWNSL